MHLALYEIGKKEVRKDRPKDEIEYDKSKTDCTFKPDLSLTQTKKTNTARATTA